MMKLGPAEKIDLYYSGTEKLSPPKEYEMSCFLLQEILDSKGVWLITLNEPKKLNPMTPKMTWEMLLLTHHLHHMEKLKCVLWVGAGRAFCAGGDFSGGADFNGGMPQEVVDGYVHHKVAFRQPDIALSGIVYQMLTLPQPSVCAVNGLAVGGGVNFAFLMHDYAVVADDATFFFPFSSLGITPEVGSSFLLPMLTGLPRAKELLMLGNKWSAQKAYQYNLVNDVCPKEEVFSRALAVAKKLTSVSQTTVRETKRMLNAPIVKNLNELLEEELSTIQKAAAGEDFQKAIIAFAQRHSGKSKKKKSNPDSKL